MHMHANAHTNTICSLPVRFAKELKGATWNWLVALLEGSATSKTLTAACAATVARCREKHILVFMRSCSTHLKDKLTQTDQCDWRQPTPEHNLCNVSCPPKPAANLPRIWLKQHPLCRPGWKHYSYCMTTKEPTRSVDFRNSLQFRLSLLNSQSRELLLSQIFLNCCMFPSNVLSEGVITKTQWRIKVVWGPWMKLRKGSFITTRQYILT